MSSQITCSRRLITYAAAARTYLRGLSSFQNEFTRSFKPLAVVVAYFASSLLKSFAIKVPEMYLPAKTEFAFHSLPHLTERAVFKDKIMAVPPLLVTNNFHLLFIRSKTNNILLDHGARAYAIFLTYAYCGVHQQHTPSLPPSYNRSSMCAGNGSPSQHKIGSAQTHPKEMKRAVCTLHSFIHSICFLNIYRNKDAGSGMIMKLPREEVGGEQDIPLYSDCCTLLGWQITTFNLQRHSDLPEAEKRDDRICSFIRKGFIASQGLKLLSKES